MIQTWGKRKKRRQTIQCAIEGKHITFPLQSIDEVLEWEMETINYIYDSSSFELNSIHLAINLYHHVCNEEICKNSIQLFSFLRILMFEMKD